MKYTECKWHDAKLESPSQKGFYPGAYHGLPYRGFWSGVTWDSPIDFWSEIPTNPTDEELDEEAYLANIRLCDIPITPRQAFLAGCASARRRELSKK